MLAGIKQITVLSGGIGGAKFVAGLRHLVENHDPEIQINVIANTADDIWVHGLKVCPDLDSIMYHLGGGNDLIRGWGRAEESWQCKEELAAYGMEPSWFGLGDRDLATHLVRTQLLAAGYSLTEVTAAVAKRWQPRVQLLPMSNDRVESHLVVEQDGQKKAIHFQEYWLKHRAKIPAESHVLIGLAEAQPTTEVITAIKESQLILISPSNPIVSIGPILALPGMREALRAARAPIVGVSGIINGDHVQGMARQLLNLAGIAVSPVGVAELYGSRQQHGILDAWLIASEDADLVSKVDSLGIKCAAAPLWMSSDAATATMITTAIELTQDGN